MSTIDIIATGLGAADSTVKIITDDNSNLTITELNNKAQLAAITANSAAAISPSPVSQSIALNASIAALTTSNVSMTDNFAQGNYTKAISDFVVSFSNLAQASGSVASMSGFKPIGSILQGASSLTATIGLGISNYESISTNTPIALNELKLQFQEGDLKSLDVIIPDGLSEGWDSFKFSLSDAYSKIDNFINNADSPNAAIYSNEAMNAINEAQSSLGNLADSSGLVIEGITVNIDSNNIVFQV